VLVCCAGVVVLPTDGPLRDVSADPGYGIAEGGQRLNDITLEIVHPPTLDR
jgi:hypothetical protein